jgi:hypothetical protein
MWFRRVRRFLSLTAFFGLAAVITPLEAQYVQPPAATETYGAARDWNDDIPAHISFVEGAVSLEREGRLEPAEANFALLAGDRLRTRTGRVEILYADGSALYLDESTDLDLLADSLVRLLTGRLRFSIARTNKELEYRIDAPAASVWLQTAGEYRVDVRRARLEGTEVELSVIRGSAELVNEHGRTLVRAGMNAVTTADLAPSLPYVANSADWDDFDVWVDHQRTARLGGYSTRYLPTELTYYGGAFDTYGSWDYLPAYGNVWYPRVGPGWRPYSQGRWSFTGHFGWFWVGMDRWSWPTHHYGRWGVNAGSWYWIPDRRWSPAWVSWGAAPGYVGWCPLGFNGFPVYGFGHPSPWNAWTVLPGRYFVPNVWVTQHTVAHTAIPPVVKTQFVERPVAPIVPMIATPRVAPIHAPTFTRAAAVPRTGPAYDGEEAWRSRVTKSAVPRAMRAGSAGNREDASFIVQPDTNVARTVPQRSRLAGVGHPVVPATRVPRVEVPQATLPNLGGIADTGAERATSRRVPSTQSGDDTRIGYIGTSQPQGSARPRPDVQVLSPEVRQPPPTQRVEPDRGSSRVPDRAAPRPPSAGDPGMDPSVPRFGTSRGEPSRPAPPQQSQPDRGLGRAAPRESSPPPSAAPPPSSTTPPGTAPTPGRGGSPTGPAPPAPPSSRGGGSAVPRQGGGGD